jgi:lysophospholipase L1-like esterase
MAWGYGIASNVTVRELTTIAIGGRAVRVRVSNVFGRGPMKVGAASVALDAGGAAIQPGSLRPLQFGGASGTTVPAGSSVYSDPAQMTVTGRETLAISLYVTGSDLVSLHPCCDTQDDVSYFTPNGAGNLTSSVGSTGFSIASPYPRWVDAVDVLETSGKGSIVVIGDSITDGYNATQRWTDVLQERIDRLPFSEQRAVINEGITANALTSVVPTYSATGGGPPGLERIAPDAIDQPGVSEIVLFLGTNDLFFGATAQQLIAGYRQAISEVHAAGLRIVAVTLLPRQASSEFRWTPEQQSYLEQVDTWIRTSGAFDGVLDLARAVSAIYNGACMPYSMFSPFDSGDHLHPNSAGQIAMADAVDPAVLELPPLVLVPPQVPTGLTAGCPFPAG